MFLAGIKRVSCGFLLFTSLNAFSEVVLTEKFEHYSIAPTTRQQIKIELRANSPVVKENQLFHGRTQWQLTPVFGLQTSGNLCRLVGIKVYLEGLYTMPEMSNRKTAAENLKQTFDDYYTALLDHEKGHQAIWIEAGESIERKLKSMPPHFQCSQLKSQASKQVAKLVKFYQLQNKQYDQDTGHGKTQGVFISAK
ncbi:DUF922 domain-containing protein [Aliiglaciecola sp. 2_MG-2023]|uniref:DUF922 domain-containing Zn-dependent protease n=1 Tax=unclassified Aliiglaciecola TaxID=2593648 RepID=UPI0026E21917|nr:MULTISPECIES: DUF922 domain-containing protein [unclassified Aliiglaciecola]MDO6712974.1 DUF922 domain-containing protein [Aliiglaciecola sp. 2_MG-2023]MDO6754013.1 DUF922 domain-containing protein [Aliiglaciecola sp. 1_MG-2023]